MTFHQHPGIGPDSLATHRLKIASRIIAAMAFATLVVGILTKTGVPSAIAAVICGNLAFLLHRSAVIRSKEMELAVRNYEKAPLLPTMFTCSHKVKGMTSRSTLPVATIRFLDPLHAYCPTCGHVAIMPKPVPFWREFNDGADAK